MKAAPGNIDAEALAQIVDALFELRGGNDDVIETIHHAMLIHDATG